ncbi:hypothetical protein KIN20_031309 [Parelaphostrongylus tenuis]|uniref:Uncharacterized protein n=1 Tax=Parelaphostrongylus tenuis TaxID=148309 RepID=A0AAD5WHI4_PARTN|nr:hypothetical protein KIN20_031309 [Parelaphostrongylus tenuis]
MVIFHSILILALMRAMSVICCVGNYDINELKFEVFGGVFAISSYAPLVGHDAVHVTPLGKILKHITVDEKPITEFPQRSSSPDHICVKVSGDIETYALEIA